MHRIQLIMVLLMTLLLSAPLEAQDCIPESTGNGCQPTVCPIPGEECQPVCLNVDPFTGGAVVITCECLPIGGCHIEAQPGTFLPCVQPDNGFGTVNLPPIGCEYQSPLEKWIIDNGLPAGATIELDGPIKNFINVVPGAGGSLGGETQNFDATLEVLVLGTGPLAGFQRNLFIPLAIETHSAPRVPGSPVQSFDIEMFQLEGELFGDPDFCTFRIRAGSSFGLPSPGHTILTELPGGQWAVESFFDIHYEIEFQGCPGSILEGFGGTTQSTIRVNMGALTPICVGQCPTDQTCDLLRTVNPDGSIDFCCQCELLVCEPTLDGLACKQGTCPEPSDECVPVCIAIDPQSGQHSVVDCVCQTPDVCYIVPGVGDWAPCVRPSVGGTAELPPVGCDYQSPNENWQIEDGLPAGATIEFDAPITDFTSIVTGPGGSLGGEIEQFDAILDAEIFGTGVLAGFSRSIDIPVSIETHSAPRVPGDPVQSFDTDMFSLQGEIFGDPDFCTLKFTAGISFGLASPGHTTLTQLPSSDFSVESFFDIEYQIEFQGCPGSILDGMSGTTTGTIRVRTGALPPSCRGNCDPPDECLLTVTVTDEGLIKYCCTCGADVCDTQIGDADNSGGMTPIDIDDVVYLISYIFSGGFAPTPYPVASGDADCSCSVDIDDVVYLIAFIFGGGPAPCSCEEWVASCGAIH